MAKNWLDESPDNPERNLNPIPAAVVAMILFCDEYGRQNGGSMDFWDRLSGRRKVHCKSFADQVLAAAHSTR